MRWYLLISTDAINTIRPVNILNPAMKRITKPTLSNNWSTILNTRVRSIIETFGNRCTISCWKRADTSLVGMRVITTWNCGASSNTPVGNTTRKLVCILFQSTARKLPTMVGITEPCTLNSMVSPISILLFFANLSSSEMNMAPEDGSTLPVHFPFVIFSVDVIESRNVTRYSRSNIHWCMSILLSFCSVSTVMLLTFSNRIFTIGTLPSTDKPCCLANAITLSFCTGCISNKTVFDWLPLADNITRLSKIDCTENMVQIKAVPKPMATINIVVWLLGRNKLASPCRHR